MLDIRLLIHGVEAVKIGEDCDWLDLRDGEGHEVTVFTPGTIMAGPAAAADWWMRFAAAILAAIDLPGHTVPVDSTILEPALARQIGELQKAIFDERNEAGFVHWRPGDPIPETEREA